MFSSVELEHYNNNNNNKSNHHTRSMINKGYSDAADICVRCDSTSNENYDNGNWYYFSEHRDNHHNPCNDSNNSNCNLLHCDSSTMQVSKCTNTDMCVSGVRHD